MLDIKLLKTSPATREPVARLLLAHGAGAGMDSPFMTEMATLLGARGIEVVRFEFAYMARRRLDGKRRPPPPVAALEPEFIAAVTACHSQAASAAQPLLIGGKSMGGRIATLIAPSLFASGAICGVICLGYPFHPARKPQSPGQRPSLVRQAITLLVHYPGLGRDVPVPARLSTISSRGAALLVELLELTRQVPGLTPGALVERFRDRPEGPHLGELLTGQLLVSEAAAARELADSLQRIVAQGRDERLAELVAKAAADGLTAAEKEEFRQLQRAGIGDSG